MLNLESTGLDEMNRWLTAQQLPSRGLTYPPDKAYLKMMFLFPRLGYVNFLEGMLFGLVQGLLISSYVFGHKRTCNLSCVPQRFN